MYSVDEIIEQIDQESGIEDNVGDVEDAEDVSQENEDENATKIKAKVKRKGGSRPKLDAERLKGSRGLICMEKMFSELNFKGHGYEKQDLNQIMNTLQYWCHRLYPKFTFDDCLAQLERLGTKKPVITLKKKILFDMIEDLVADDSEIIDDVIESQQEELSEFDMLLNQEPIPTPFTTQPATADVVELTEEQKEMIARNRQLAAERRQARLEAMKEKQDSSQTPTNSQSPKLTEEQRLIIEKNRLLAVEKRRQLQNKLNIFENNLSQCSSQNITLEYAINPENEMLNKSTNQENETETIDDSTNQENEMIDEYVNQENDTEKIDDST